MSLQKEFISFGNWLFKYRSYIPILLIPLLLYLLNNHNNIKYYNILLISAISISTLGEIIRIYTVSFVYLGTSGRNTKKQVARDLNTTGIYSIVRHPLYLGNFLIYLGPFIYIGNLYSILIFILFFIIYYERIMLAEEAFLINKFGDKYIKWSSVTPAFIPKINLYIKHHGNFSIKKVIYREYTGISAIIFLFILMISYRNYINNIYPIISNIMITITIITFIFYISARTLKKIS